MSWNAFFDVRMPAPEDYDRDDVIPILPGEGREFYARLGYRY